MNKDQSSTGESMSRAGQWGWAQHGSLWPASLQSKPGQEGTALQLAWPPTLQVSQASKPVQNSQISQSPHRAPPSLRLCSTGGVILSLLVALSYIWEKTEKLCLLSIFIITLSGNHDPAHEHWVERTQKLSASFTRCGEHALLNGAGGRCFFQLACAPGWRRLAWNTWQCCTNWGFGESCFYPLTHNIKNWKSSLSR